ncbi:hypothetical protein VNO78_20239 [Psophocarpus tetragonolobus]|uniref:Uncharacterized protein n=1 Tax=Psophocarpus tetragonolobus TaxID=3891 RepID=A0AAN9SA06_PSOTE
MLMWRRQRTHGGASATEEEKVFKGSEEFSDTPKNYLKTILALTLGLETIHFNVTLKGNSCWTFRENKSNILPLLYSNANSLHAGNTSLLRERTLDEVLHIEVIVNLHRHSGPPASNDGPSVRTSSSLSQARDYWCRIIEQIGPCNHTRLDAYKVFGEMREKNLNMSRL